MNRYFRLLAFARPYRLHILFVFGLAMVYTVLDTSSYWLSASFLNTLFNPDQLTTIHLPGPAGAMPAATRSLASSLNATLNGWTNRLVVGPSRDATLIRVCVILFFSFLLKNVISYFKNVRIGFIELRVINDIRKRLVDHIIRLPLPFFDNRKSGELISIVINDVGIINQAVTNSFQDLVLVPLDLVVKLTILFIINWKLTVVTLILVPLLGVIISTIGSSIRRKSMRTMGGIAKVVDSLQEMIPNIKIVKAYDAEEREIRRFDRLNQDYFRLAFRQKTLSQLTTPLNEVIGAGLAAYLLWYGGSQIFRGAGFAAGDFVKYLILLFAMFQPIRKVSGLNNNIQMGMGAGERVYDILDQAPETDEGTVTLRSLERDISLTGISFRYRDDGPDVLTDINLEVHKGEVVAFVGPSGAGKTTLVHLIPRFYSPRTGRILIDGTPITELTLHSLREQIGMVTQETILFNRSVLENIAYSAEEVDEAAILRASRVAHADEFILASADGLRTVVGERGMKFSGGQKQRLSIARAVLKNSPILILDEATSSLDSESEQLVQNALDNLMKDRTVLVIAHRLSTVIHADKIVVMNNGRIVDVGPHARLVDTCPLYRHLYEIQFRAGTIENHLAPEA
jgi:ATP-binding cassette, subfamily B, bacterial MsbA